MEELTEEQKIILFRLRENSNHGVLTILNVLRKHDFDEEKAKKELLSIGMLVLKT